MTSNREIHSVPENALQCGCHHPTRKLRCTRIRGHTGVHRAPHWTDDHWVEWRR